MKTRTHQQGFPRRPTATSISHRSGFLAALDSWMGRIGQVLIRIGGLGSRRSNHLRLVRRNGRPVPVPLRAVVKTRNPRPAGIVVGVLLVLSLAAAGIGGSIYLDLRARAISLPQ